MKFVDEADIYIKAGNGGHGCVSFRRERFIPRGGPDGGDGGKGGDVVLVGSKALSSLLDFKYKRIYRAENGKNGSGKNKKGRGGKDLYIHLPLGTIVYDKAYTTPLCDVTEDNKHYIVAKSGRGGRGNTHFVTPTHRAPVEFENGTEGEEKELKLVLKLLADVGIVGLPNVGKSTLISCLTNAKPLIGDYPFTTLTPALGVFRDNDDTFVIADIPGLIKDASKGRGLGLTFLRHIERTNIFLLVLDASSESADKDYDTLLDELKSYKEEMLDKKRILVLNKIDISSKASVKKWNVFFKEKGETTVNVSALKGQGIDELRDLLKGTTRHQSGIMESKTVNKGTTEDA
ncbi:MAG: GTPase ObgE [Proteobacteria bacterium]|nr:GTPase ObgE [Pseudomonadota bacterium]